MSSQCGSGRVCHVLFASFPQSLCAYSRARGQPLWGSCARPRVFACYEREWKKKFQIFLSFLFGLVPFHVSLKSAVFNTIAVHIKDKIYLVYAYHFMPSLNFKCTIYFFFTLFVWFTVCGCRNRVNRKERLKLKVLRSLAQLCFEQGIAVAHENCCSVLQASWTIVAVQIFSIRF